MKHLRIYLSIFLFSLFAAYQISISMFIHSHYINGIKIVHSHPFNSPHNHTTSELVLISQLSDCHTLEAHTFLPDFTITLPESVQNTIYAVVDGVPSVVESPSLRAPPVL